MRLLTPPSSRQGASPATRDLSPGDKLRTSRTSPLSRSDLVHWHTRGTPVAPRRVRLLTCCGDNGAALDGGGPPPCDPEADLSWIVISHCSEPLRSLRTRLVCQRFDVGDQPNEIVFANLSGKRWHLRFISGDDTRIRQQDGLAYISFVRNDGAAVLEGHRRAIKSLQRWPPQRARSHMAAAATKLLEQRCAFAHERAACQISARTKNVPIRSGHEEQDKKQEIHCAC